MMGGSGLPLSSVLPLVAYVLPLRHKFRREHKENDRMILGFRFRI
jgi:hypothetical protein